MPDEFLNPRLSQSKNVVIVEVIAGLLVLAGILYFVYSVKYRPAQPSPTPSPTPGAANPMPIEQVSDVIGEESEGPAEKLPDTNPFADSYENPFN